MATLSRLDSGRIDRIVRCRDPWTNEKVEVAATYMSGVLRFYDPTEYRAAGGADIQPDADNYTCYEVDTSDIAALVDPLLKLVWELFWESDVPMGGHITVHGEPIEVREHVRFGQNDCLTGVVLQRLDGRAISVPRQLYDERVAPSYPLQPFVNLGGENSVAWVNEDRRNRWMRMAEVVAENPDFARLRGMEFVGYVDHLVEQEEADQADHINSVADSMKPLLDRLMAEQREADELLPLSELVELEAFLAG